MKDVHPTREFTGNVLGALADELCRQMDRSVFDRVGIKGESSATLTALLHSPGLSIKDLARFLGISSPSAVQLITGLELSGLIQRRPGPDARTRSLVLTPAGRRAARAVLTTRGDVTKSVLASVSAAERPPLTAAIVVMLETLTRGGADPDHLCRRCDESVCLAEACPVELGALQ